MPSIRMAKKQSYFILNGAGRDSDDFGILKKLAKGGGAYSGWGCTRSVRKGDRVFFYITKPKSAIVAQGIALEDAWKGTSRDHWRYNTKVGEVRLLRSPIPISEIKERFPGWSKWYHPQGQGWRVPDEFVAGLLARADVDSAAAKTSSSANSGAGFGSPESNRKVELAAVKAVTQSLSKAGWKVKSVEKQNLGYDLLATKGTQTQHVEVKGVAGDVPEFIITQNELACAKSDKAFVLAVVTGALTARQRRIEQLQSHALLSRYDFKPVSFWAKTK